MKRIILIGLIIILLTGCQKISKCEEAAKVDFSMEIVKCGEGFNGKCYCEGFVCKELSCIENSYKNFYLKEDIIGEQK